MIYIDIDTDIDGIDLDETLPTISEQRRNQALRFRNERDRRLSVAAYLLLKRALREEYDICDNPIFGYEDGGKPYIVGHKDIFFNISHCRCAAVCAVSNRPIGIDVETIRPFKEALAQYVLNDSEYRLAVSTEHPDVEFTKLWTMKESLLKLTGKGLREDLKTLLPCNDADFHTFINIDFIYTVCQRNER